MTHILGISFDCEVSPSIIIKPYKIDKSQENCLYGWGYGWYPNNQDAATVIKDATAAKSEGFIRAMAEWQRFNSTIFICHIRGAVKDLVQKNTQPFSRTFAGADWLMLHNGDLIDYKAGLPLAEDPLFEPVGTTDSEYLFCWLMHNISAKKVRSLQDLDLKILHEWFLKINSYGTANLILSDGRYLVVYQDKNLFNPIYYCRRTPPYKSKSMESSDVIVDLSGDLESTATMMVFSNEALTKEDNWVQMKPGQMLVVRQGWLTWDSHAGEEVNTPVLAHSSRYQASVKKAKPEIYKYRIVHETRYHYDSPIHLSKHVLRLKPSHNYYQELISHKISITPKLNEIEYEDVFGNNIYYGTIEKSYTDFLVTAESVVKVHPQHRVVPEGQHHQRIPLVWMPWQRQMMSPYLLPMELPESNLRSLSDYAMSFVTRSDYNLLSVLHDINRAIYNDYVYEPKVTSLQTTPFEVFENRRGVCQDFANLFICLAQLLNIPARYRTGYIYTGSDYANQLQSEASHAWVEVYLPRMGWLGYDPTNGIHASTDHIQVACGRNYRDATPTAGTIYEGGGNETLYTNVKVERI